MKGRSCFEFERVSKPSDETRLVRKPKSEAAYIFGQFNWAHLCSALTSSRILVNGKHGVLIHIEPAFLPREERDIFLLVRHEILARASRRLQEALHARHLTHARRGQAGRPRLALVAPTLRVREGSVCEVVHSGRVVHERRVTATGRDAVAWRRVQLIASGDHAQERIRNSHNFLKSCKPEQLDSLSNF